MAVDFVQTWTWGPIVNPGALQKNYFRIPFAGTPHIIGSAYLAEVSIGGTDGQAGVAAATFKRIEFLYDQGIVQETEFTDVSSYIEVVNCVSITIALNLVDATGCGGWTFHWLS
jgi:hypothetical protein